MSNVSVQINKILFDTLAKRSSLAVGRLGTLGVKRLPADSEGNPPRFVVSLTNESAEYTLEKELVLAGLSTREEAPEMEREWVDGCLTEQDGAIFFIVPDVVTIRQQAGTTEIIPSPRLESFLNPVVVEDPVDTRSNPVRTMGITLTLVILLGGLGFYLYQSGVFSRFQTGSGIPELDSIAVTVPQAEELPDLSAEDYIQDSIINATIAANERIKEEQAKLEEEKQKAQAEKKSPAEILSDVKGAMHHVVVGSFAVRENAEKLVARLKKDFPQAKSFPYGSQTVVVIFSEKEKETAVRRLEALPADQKPKEYWYLEK